MSILLRVRPRVATVFQKLMVLLLGPIISMRRKFTGERSRLPRRPPRLRLLLRQKLPELRLSLSKRDRSLRHRKLLMLLPKLRRKDLPKKRSLKPRLMLSPLLRQRRMQLSHFCKSPLTPLFFSSNNLMPMPPLPLLRWLQPKLFTNKS